MKRLSLLLVFVLAACATVPPPPPAPAEPVHVVIVGTTDVHGWFNGREQESKDVPVVRYGGVATLASYIDALRAENGGRVVVVDSGDMWQGTLESNLPEGEPVVIAYNTIGYAGAAVGNHEFDYGPLGPGVIADEPGEDPFGVLKRNASRATFPFLSANMVEKATGQTPSWAKKYTIVSVGGVRVGIIGLSTPDTPKVTIPTNVATLQFTDPVAATISASSELRAQGVDAVIVIAHIGGRCRDTSDPKNTVSCEKDQEVMEYLQALPAGTIDAWFAGHTHSQMRQFINGVATTQGLPQSNEFSTIDLWVDPNTRRVIPDRTNIRPLTMICTMVYAGTETCDVRKAKPGATLVPRVFAGRTITPDMRVASAIQPYLDAVEAKRNEPLNITTTAPATRNYSAESDLGNLITDALRTMYDADIAFFNSGGIRANLRAGDLKYSDIFEVSPFDNYPAVVMMSGAQIMEALRATTQGGRGILQVSGLRYTVDESKDADKPEAERNRIVSATLENGQAIDPQKMYKVVMPDFLVAGGDNMASATRGIPSTSVVVYQNRPIRDVLIEGLQKRPGPIVPRREGRITIVNRRPSNEARP
jgi:5'-nucleotidase